jgi:hypothetical protein
MIGKHKAKIWGLLAISAVLAAVFIIARDSLIHQGIRIRIARYLPHRVVIPDRPESPVVRMTRRAFEYLEEGKPEMAEEIAKKLETTDDLYQLDTARALKIQVAIEFLEQGNLEKAEMLSKEVSESGSVNQNPYWELLQGGILLKRGRGLEALERFERAKAQALRGPFMCGNSYAGTKIYHSIPIAECYEQLGRHKAAYLEYLGCTPYLRLHADANVVNGLRRVRKQLTEEEKVQVDEKAFNTMIRIVRIEGFQLNFVFAADPEKERRRIEPEMYTCSEYLYSEAKRFGLMSAYTKTEEALDSAYGFETDGKYKKACLEYLNALEFPWLYADAKPVQSLKNLRPKLNQAEGKHVDAEIAKMVRESLQKDYIVDRIKSFAPEGPEAPRYWLGPEEAVFPFILETAEKMGLDVPVSSAELNLRIARHNVRIGNHWEAYNSYVNCIKIPWPYDDAEPVEEIVRLRKKWDRNGKLDDEIDEKLKARLAEVLHTSGFKKEMEAYAKRDAQSVDLTFPRDVVYPFIIDEAKRLGLLEDYGGNKRSESPPSLEPSNSQYEKAGNFTV